MIYVGRGVSDSTQLFSDIDNFPEVDDCASSVGLMRFAIETVGVTPSEPIDDKEAVLLEDKSGKVAEEVLTVANTPGAWISDHTVGYWSREYGIKVPFAQVNIVEDEMVEVELLVSVVVLIGVAQMTKSPAQVVSVITQLDADVDISGRGSVAAVIDASRGVRWLML